MIELDKPRKLRFGMGEAMEFEQTSGVKLSEVTELTFEQSCLALWIMLKETDKDLTQENVTSIVDEHAPSLSYIVTKVSQAVTVGAVGTLDPNPQTPPAKKAKQSS